MANEPHYSDDYLAELVHRYADMMMRIAFTYLKNSADAQHICQEVFLYLYYFESYSTAEIAGLLRRNESTVRTQLKRARELLKTSLAGGLANE